MSRASELGTLQARQGAINAVAEQLPLRWLHGVGYSASRWLTSKFGGGDNVPKDFGRHNFVVEQLWYVGLPGLLLFLVVVAAVFARAAKSLSAADPSRRGGLSVLAAFLFGMFVVSLANGGVSIGYYFFFFAGVMAGRAHDWVGREEETR